MLSFVRAFLCSASAFLVLMLSATPATASPKTFSIEAEEAPRALLEFGRQSALQILFASEKVKGVITNAVHGTYEPVEALKLLLKGTTLVVSVKPDGVLVVGPQANAHSTSNEIPASVNDTGGSTLLAQATHNSAESSKSSQGPDQNSSSSVARATEENKTKLEEIVVTGSRIPMKAMEGAQEVKIYSREQIEQSGQTTVADFLSTVPSVSISNGENGYQGYGGASSVQLHGLPQGTTLVLINGRRVESVSGIDQFNNLFDLNTIPLAAVERVEVVPEASSAIYGSDALAGVVNIILKKDLDGVEVSAKYRAASGLRLFHAQCLFSRRYHASHGSRHGNLCRSPASFRRCPVDTGICAHGRNTESM